MNTPKPYVTRQGCLVETRFELRNGQMAEHITLSGTGKIAKLFRDPPPRR